MQAARLVLLTGPNKGKVVEIAGPVSIGRSQDSSVHLDDLQVSRAHAMVKPEGGRYILRDLGSGNGTYIGNRKVLEYRLSNGDIIRIGQQEMRFEEDAAAVTPTADGVRFKSGPEGRLEAADAATMYQTLFQSGAERPGAKKGELADVQRRLQVVYAANQIIASETNLSKLFERVMEEIFKLVPAHNGVILLKDKQRDELITEYVKTGAGSGEVIISSSIVKRASEKGEAVLVFDAADDSRFGAGASIIAHNISSAMCVPLLHQQEILGVLYVDTRGTANAFVSGDLELLVALAGPSAIAIKNAQYVRMLEQAYQDTLIVLANAIEMRDHYTVGHTWRVTNFSVEIAKELGWSEEKVKEVQMGGVLHDVGKIAVDDAILRKPGKLTDEEYAKMKVHPERGARLLEDVAFLHPLIPYCLYHHEHFNGRGYPFGLAGEAIPIEGRLVAVADTFDALTSNRPYRKGFAPEVAIEEIERGKGTQFDPQMADALVRAYRAGKIDRILQDYYKADTKSIACTFCSTHIQLPENAAPGHEFSCQVCHRVLRLEMQNDAWYAEIVPQSSLRTSQPMLTPLPSSIRR